MNRTSLLLCGFLGACAAHAQQTGLPASDTLGADGLPEQRHGDIEVGLSLVLR